MHLYFFSMVLYAHLRLSPLAEMNMPSEGYNFHMRR